MKLLSLVSALALTASFSAQASSDFCAPMAAKAAQALANANGSVSETVKRTLTNDGAKFYVQLAEEGLGQDLYEVNVEGSHACVVMSIRVVGHPTMRP